jgi:hypothetical protein
MAVLIVALLLLLAVLWLGRGKRVLTRGEWRAGAGLLGIACLVGAALVAIRGNWADGLGLLALGAVLIGGARSRRGPYASGPRGAAGPALSEREARAVLGVGETAGPQEIRAAHARLMAKIHPDQGGTHGLAAQVNAARDVLLRRQP